MPDTDRSGERASEPSCKTIRVHLAEKPRDLLIYLAEHGPTAPVNISRALNVRVGLYSGGLNLLHELGLAALDHGTGHWSATDEGLRLWQAARDA